MEQPEPEGLTDRETEILSTYHAEVSRGLVHTSGWKIAMGLLQVKYDRWAHNGKAVI